MDLGPTTYLFWICYHNQCYLTIPRLGTGNTEWMKIPQRFLVAEEYCRWTSLLMRSSSTAASTNPQCFTLEDNNLVLFIDVFTTSWLAWRDTVYLVNFIFSEYPKWYNFAYPQSYFLLYFRAWPSWISTLHTH